VSLDNSLIVIESQNKKFLTVIKTDEEFITNDGKISYNEIKSLPSTVISSTGKEFYIYTPSYKEFVLLMRRGPQIIYPKDVGSIIVEANINNNSSVLEIGTGSGALTLFLILIIGKNGKVFSIDSEKKNQFRAKKTIERYVSSFSKEFEYNLKLIHSELINISFNKISENIDTIITDVPEPWEFFVNNKIEKDIMWVSYLPSISQVEKLTKTLKDNNFKNIEIKENLERYWIIKDKILRPKNEMVGHTGFIVSSRYISE
tara:strand:+ start:3640 stop:4416 length:777 start_codon:yes stop_codon:yes gene_type:complete